LILKIKENLVYQSLESRKIKMKSKRITKYPRLGNTEQQEQVSRQKPLLSEV